jgi:hypothetical protein
VPLDAHAGHRRSFAALCKRPNRDVATPGHRPKCGALLTQHESGRRHALLPSRTAVLPSVPIQMFLEPGNDGGRPANRRSHAKMGAVVVPGGSCYR